MAKVRAIKPCFFGDVHRHPDKPSGQCFECPTKEQFSELAMELLDGESFDEPKVKAKTGPKPKAKVESSDE